MRIVMAWYLAGAAALAAASTVAAEPRMSLKSLLSQRVEPTRFDAIPLPELIEKVSIQIHTPILLDTPAFEGRDALPTKPLRFHQPSQSAHDTLTAILKAADADDRYCFTAAADKYGRFELLFTTRTAARERGLLVIPYAEAVDPRKVAVSVEFEKNTLENGLLLVCSQLGAKLRLDTAGLAEAAIPVTRQFGVKVSSRPASTAVDEMLRRFDPTHSLSHVFADDAEGKPVLVVATKRRLKDFGPRPSLANFDDIPETPVPGPHQLWRVSSPARWVSDALAKPVSGEPRELSLDEALRLISQATKLPIEISVIDFQAAGITCNQRVTFDPRKREARAVLYDVLWQADPDRKGTLVACLERREDDAFAIVVITRQAANSSGRSLLADYNLTPDDLPNP